jgi:hypothetical protein
MGLEIRQLHFALPEANKKDHNHRKEKQAGVHYDKQHLHSGPTLRKGS